MPVLNSATRDYALRTTPVLCATASRGSDSARWVGLDSLRSILTSLAELAIVVQEWQP
jgi:hypothetical protein